MFYFIFIMGVAFSPLVKPVEASLEDLTGKIIIVDAMNMLYQFVTTIRQYDGTPLKDSHGNITSHLTGLFARCTRLMQKGLKLAFVFDGKMPKLKAAERARRESLKTKAMASLKEATESNDVEGMKKYSVQSTKISTDMIEESKSLLKALGIPVIQAPSEGEGQAAYMVRKGDGDFVGSQDYDCLLYGAPKMIKNLSLSQRRKKINALTYKVIMPEILTLKDVLKDLDLSINQLRALAMIVGTDFNIGGIKGLGPKKGLIKVKEFEEDFDALFKEINWSKFFDIPWQDVYEIVSNIPTTDDYKLEWGDVNKDKVMELMVTKHDFSESRVLNSLEELEKNKLKSQQSSLNKFF